MAESAQATAAAVLSDPLALAPPASNNARAAGTGKPMASRNTAANRMP
jgi:hypothetical protein